MTFLTRPHLKILNLRTRNSFIENKADLSGKMPLTLEHQNDKMSFWSIY